MFSEPSSTSLEKEDEEESAQAQAQEQMPEWARAQAPALVRPQAEEAVPEEKPPEVPPGLLESPRMDLRAVPVVRTSEGRNTFDISIVEDDGDFVLVPVEGSGKGGHQEPSSQRLSQPRPPVIRSDNTPYLVIEPDNRPHLGIFSSLESAQKQKELLMAKLNWWHNGQPANPAALSEDEAWDFARDPESFPAAKHEELSALVNHYVRAHGDGPVFPKHEALMHRFAEETETLWLDGDEAWSRLTGKKPWWNDHVGWDGAYKRFSWFAAQGEDVERMRDDENLKKVREKYALKWNRPEVAYDDAALDKEISKELKGVRLRRRLLVGYEGDDDEAKSAREESLYARIFNATLQRRPWREALTQWQRWAAKKTGDNETPEGLAASEDFGREAHTDAMMKMGEAQLTVDEVMRQFTAAKKFHEYSGQEPPYVTGRIVGALQRLRPEIRGIAFGMIQNEAAKTGDRVQGGFMGTKAFFRGMEQFLTTGPQRSSLSKGLEFAEEYLKGMKPGDRIPLQHREGDTTAAAFVRAAVESGNRFSMGMNLHGPPLGEKDIADIKAEIDRNWDSLDIMITLEQIAHGTYDPIKGSGVVSGQIYNPFMEKIAPGLVVVAATRKLPLPSRMPRLLAVAARATPAMIPMYGMTKDQNAQLFKALNPDMTIQEAYRLGGETALIQTGIQYLMDLIGLGIAGKAQGMGRELLKLEGSAWAKFGGTMGKSALAQNALMAVSDLVPPFVQALRKGLSSVPLTRFFKGEAPPVAPSEDGGWTAGGRFFESRVEAEKWADEHREGGYWAQRLDTFLTLMPAVVLSGASSALRQKAGADMLRRTADSLTDTSLHAAGIREAARKAILGEIDPVNRLDKLSEALPHADQATAAEGAARLVLEREAAEAELHTRMQRAGITMEPVMIKGTAHYRVRAGENVSDHPTPQSAMEAVQSHSRTATAADAAAGETSPPWVIPDKPGFGERNRTFTRERFERAWEEAKPDYQAVGSGSQALSLTLKQMKAAILYAGLLVEDKCYAFKDFAHEMKNKFGAAVEPYLRACYENARRQLGQDITSQMTSAEEVAAAHPDAGVDLGTMTVPSLPGAAAGAKPVPPPAGTARSQQPILTRAHLNDLATFITGQGVRAVTHPETVHNVPVANPSYKRTSNDTLPADPARGRWQDPNAPGNCGWISSLPEVNALTDNQPVHYREGEMILSPYTILEFSCDFLNGRTPDFSKADDALAKFAPQLGLKNARAVRRWRRAMRLTWHHRKGGKILELVPFILNDELDHKGGSSELKKKR